MISKNNIEEKLFDYFEGNLTSEEKSMVDSFVSDNPEYKADFDAWSQASIPEEDFVFERVDELLVPTGKSKPFLFARWKTAFVFIAVSFGLSAAFLMNGTNSDLYTDSNLPNDLKISVPSAKEGNQRLVEKNNQESSENSLKNQVNDGAVGAVSDNKILVNKSLKRGSNPASNSNFNTKNTSNSGAGNNTTSIGRMNNNNSQLSSNTINKQNSNSDLIKANSSHGVNAEDVAVDNGSAKNNSQAINDDVLKSAVKDNAINNDDFAYVNLDIYELSKNDYLTNPSLKKGRSKFEAYEKNEVKFFNDKNPYIILPNALNLTLNSSFAGNTEGIRLSYLYNYQWQEFSDNYSTNLLTVDGYVKALRGGLGLVLENDVLGHNKFKTQGIAVIYSPKFKLSGNVSLEPSVRYGYYQKSISWNQLKSSQMIDPRTGLLKAEVQNPPADISKSASEYSNYGGGLLLNTSKFYVGVGFENLFNPTYDLAGFSKELNAESKLTAQAGGSVVPLKKYQFFVLQPALYYIKTGNWENLWFSNTVVLNRLFIGTSYSTNKDFMCSLGYESNHLRINYSYGLSQPAVSGVKDLSSHQLGLVFLLKPRK